MLSTAAISTPGVRNVFAQAMTELKRKSTNGIPSDVDTGSDTDDRHNETVIEKQHERE
ncbi:unnamed protein product [Haemonchus placei]|uniref:Uncharacterized protein n=1 Tax=Haemonchus placei TaxID=6290 RepID=A0A0N4WHW5_HAEPC|nr:unnamed protein product [Haemonchus placei]